MHEIAIFSVLGVLLVWAAVSDLRARRIANWLTLAVAALGLVRIALDIPAHGGGALADVGAALAVFALGFVFFALGALGGGDVKLLAGVSLCLGAGQVPVFLWVTALLGGILALAFLALRGLRRAAASPDPPQQGLPYGLAIAGAGLWIGAGLI